MARRQRRLVIIGAARARAAAIGRQRDDDIAERGARGSGRRRRADRDRRPARPRPRGCALQLGECPAGLLQRRQRIRRRRMGRACDPYVARAAHDAFARHPASIVGCQRIEQRLRRVGRVVHADSRRRRDRRAARRRSPARRARPHSRRGRARRDNRASARRCAAPRAAVAARCTSAATRSATAAMRSGSGRLAKAVKARPSQCRQRVLERDGAGEHAAVEFRQHHVHGEVGGAEAARAVAPCRALGGREHRLEHRHVRAVERRRLARLAAGGEGRRGDDRGGREPRQRVAHEGRGGRLLEARDHQRRRRQAARRQRLAQRIDRARCRRRAAARDRT